MHQFEERSLEKEVKDVHAQCTLCRSYPDMCFPDQVSIGRLYRYYVQLPRPDCQYGPVAHVEWVKPAEIPRRPRRVSTLCDW